MVAARAGQRRLLRLMQLLIVACQAYDCGRLMAACLLCGHKKRGCVVMHDAPSFFVSPKNQFMYFKLRYFGDISDLCVPNI